jgi:tol-pal system-associated acyl-CoA thioesterase
MNEFVYTTRVYYEDTDAAGVVYYANYLKWMERARTEWLQGHGFTLQQLGADGYALVVHRADLTYRFPARLEECVGVTCTLDSVGFSSIKIVQSVYRLGDEKLLTKGCIELATIDLNTFKPRGLPVELKASLKSLLPRLKGL